MPTAASSQQLVTQQLTQLQALEELLTLENDKLKQHDPFALNEVTRNKNDLLIAIKTLDNQIAKNQQFLQDKKAGFMQDALNDIASVLARCQAKNQINGAIIQQSQLTVERMKTTLLEKRSKSSLTYNSKGKKIQLNVREHCSNSLFSNCLHLSIPNTHIRIRTSAYAHSHTHTYTRTCVYKYA